MKNLRRMLCFAGRCAKEIVRDPLTLFFGLAFPILLLLLLSLIQAHIPVDLFRVEQLAPGVAVFGQSFLALFAAMLISRDRSSAFLTRLYATPLRAVDFLLGYLLPLLPMALAQGVAVYAVALILGLPFSAGILYALAAGLAPALLYIALGLLCGTVLNDKHVGGICGVIVQAVWKPFKKLFSGSSGKPWETGKTPDAGKTLDTEKTPDTKPESDRKETQETK